MGEREEGKEGQALPSRLLLQERRNLAPSSFDYHWMLALYLWPPAKLISCLSLSNLLLCFTTHADKSTHVLLPRTRSVHEFECTECTKTHPTKKNDTFLSDLTVAAFQSSESPRSHKRRNFHTFHLLRFSLLLTLSVSSLLIALVPSARLIDQKGSECALTFA